MNMKVKENHENHHHHHHHHSRHHRHLRPALLVTDTRRQDRITLLLRKLIGCRYDHVSLTPS